MDHFADIFMMYQKRGKAKDPQGELASRIPGLCRTNHLRTTEQATLDKQLARWTSHTSPGKVRADSGPHSFSIK